jgi:hypothetical protein
MPKCGQILDVTDAKDVECENEAKYELEPDRGHKPLWLVCEECKVGLDEDGDIYRGFRRLDEEVKT